MNGKNSLIALSLLASAQFSIASWAQAETFSTLIKTPTTIEGLTGDNRGNLYVAGRQSATNTPCPIWRINIASPSLVVVGNILPAAGTACSPSGIAFDRLGNLYMSDGDKVYKVFPNQASPPTATVFASGVPGTNGLAFDRNGNLWTGDGTTGQGRVWKISPAGAVTEVLRVQPMANEVNLDANHVGGIGRDVRSLPPGTITVTDTSRNAANTLGSQPLVANGIAFNRQGDLLILDTARGAIWRAQFESDGTLRSQTGCDTTFMGNTLCLENVLVQHPLLEGADGFVLDEAGNMWVDANERNAIVVARPTGQVSEIFRNPPDATTKLRNGGPLETPTSPFLSDRKLCTSNSDGNRRDNFPSTAGEIKPAGPDRGKISCMNELVNVKGLPLPIR
jgi:sugar lactone lactonase YvrE